jgi:hypothetical protein
LGVLLLALVGVLIHDLILPARPGGDEDADEPIVIDPNPLVRLRFHDGKSPDGFNITDATMCFGLEMPNPANPREPKKLMWDALGRTNNTCVRVDGRDYLFGHPNIVFPDPGAGAIKVNGVARWVERKVALGRDEKLKLDRDGARSVWFIEGLQDRRAHVQVTQTVEVIANPQSGKLDTCLVYYTLENKDAVPHSVGIRFLLDTFIGENDGVPFTIPGKAGLCSTMQTFDRPIDVPDYIQALEKDNLLEPGTVAHLQFRLGQHRLEPPARVLLGGYPDAPLQQLGYRQANGWYTPWEVPAVSIREMVDNKDRLRNLPREPVPDSAVTLWWDVKTLQPGQKREVGFSYGLGQVASAEGEGKLLLTIGGRTVRDGEFTLTALRHQPGPGEKLTLTVPAGDRFELLSAAQQEVPPVAPGADRPISTVTWRLRALRVGRSTLVVRSSTGVRQKQAVRISPPPRGVLD